MANITTLTRAMLSDVIATGAGDAINGPSGYKTFQGKGTTSAGAGSATIEVEGSNDEGVSWDTIGTITLTLATTNSSDSFTDSSRYGSYRGNVTAISGTDATVSLIVGY